MKHPITLIAMDVDGVLTDGGIIFDDAGVETKRFNVQDGFAIKLAQKAGLNVAIITGRRSRVVQRRADDLGITHVYQGSPDKLVDLRDLCGKVGATLDQVAYIGDDWPDLTVMRAVGLAIAPANAVPEVKKVARLVTAAPGGHGAVREAIEHILHLTGTHSDALRRYDPLATDGQTTRPTF